jgi:hypothetical protein
MECKAIIFDLFETLITEWGHKKYTKKEMCADLGIDRSHFDFFWEEKEQERYMIAVMRTRMMVSESSYMPYLMVADKPNVSWESCGKRLDYPGASVFCENHVFVAKNPYTNEEICRVDIDQDSDGYDTEDRVVKLRGFLAENEKMLQTPALKPLPDTETAKTE